jgi:vitamin B12 transporter
MYLRAFAAAACAVLAALPALAAAEEPAELDPVVVTATRVPARASETLAAITVIGRDEIERAQATDVAELLRFVAGVEVARAGGPGQFAATFIRGGNSQHTLVLLDGVRLNPTTQGAALQNLHPGMVERIEIVRGPRSTLYGSDAMGGVVHVITRRHDGTATDAQARYGSYETGELSASGAFGAEQAGAQLHVARLDSRGYVPHTDGASERAHDNTTVDARGEWRAGALTLGASAWNAQGRSEYLEDSDPSCFPCTYDDPAALDFHNRALGAEVRWQPRERLDTALTLERTLDENEVVEGAFAGGTTRNERTQARWQSDWRATPGSRLSLALEHARERTLAGGVAESRDASGITVTDELTRGRHRALLAGSVYDHDAFGTARLWNAEYGYDLGRTRLSLGAGVGFRAPNVIERFFPGFGNPDLGPERARSYEAGVRRQLGNAHVELRAFRTDYEDLIQFDPAILLAGNVGHARNEGLELTSRWPLGGSTWLRVGGVAQDPRACEPGCGDGERLVRRARRSATLQLATVLGGVDCGVDVLAVGARTDFDSADFSRTTLPGYALLGLSAGAEIRPGWTLRARIENLLDAQYETVEGYRQPARSGTVTLRWALQ